jgi:hypothetical protein
MNGVTATGGCLTFRNLNTRASFAACLMTASITGVAYTFSVYSGALSTQFDFSESELATLSAVYFCTGIFSWIPGLITDKKGPKFVIRVFGLITAVALLAYWAVGTRIIKFGGAHNGKDTVLVVLAFISIVIYFGSAGLVGATFSTLVRTHPTQSGTVVGVAKGWVGIMGGMVTQMYAGLVRRPDDDVTTLNFLLFVSCVICWGSFMPSQLIIERSDEGLSDTVTLWDVKVCYGILITMGVIVTSSALAHESIDAQGQWLAALLGVAMLLIWNR